MEEVKDNKIEEREEGQKKKTKEKPKLKIHWFDWIAFFYIWLLITSLSFLNNLEEFAKNNILFEQSSVLLGLVLLMLNIISVAIIIGFGFKNIEYLKDTRLMAFVNKKPFVAQFYGIVFLSAYLIIAHLLFELIF